MTSSAYLDNSATTKPSEGVIRAMALCMTDSYYNPSSLYGPAVAAEKAMDACREAIARAIRVRPDGVFFTSGGTEANNLAIFGAVRSTRGHSHIIAFASDHPSVLNAAAALKAMGHRLTLINVNRSGQPEWEQLGEALCDPPALVACAQVNNETGAVIDMARLIQAVRRAAPGAHIHVDGVQGFLRMPFDARQIDSYALSAHKIHGPKGIGALYARPGLNLKPVLFGGGQEKGLRSGTENTPGIAGLRAAVIEMSAIFDIERSLRARKEALARALREAVPGAVIIGPAANEGAPHILNVSFPPVGGEVMLHALESAGVYVSTGAACSSRKGRVSPVLTAMSIPDNIAKCAVRFSLSPYNTFDEIFYAAEQAAAQYGVHSRYGR